MKQPQDKLTTLNHIQLLLDFKSVADHSLFQKLQTELSGGQNPTATAALATPTDAPTETLQNGPVSTSTSEVHRHNHHEVFVTIMWQSWVEIKYYSVASFDSVTTIKALQHRTSFKGGAHTQCIDLSGIHASLLCISAPPLTEVLPHMVVCLYIKIIVGEEG